MRRARTQLVQVVNGVQKHMAGMKSDADQHAAKLSELAVFLTYTEFEPGARHTAEPVDE